VRPHRDEFAATPAVGSTDTAADPGTGSDRPELELPVGGRRVAETEADATLHDRSTTGGGRHYVPDELVQAATYRLPPDRVARAKVRGASTPSELASDPTWRLPPVPKQGASS
jgi:hypothetical protein